MPTSGEPGQQATLRPISAGAGHARHRYRNAGQLLAEQHLPDERWNDQQCQPRQPFAGSRENERLFHDREQAPVE